MEFVGNIPRESDGAVGRLHVVRIFSFFVAGKASSPSRRKEALKASCTLIERRRRRVVLEAWQAAIAVRGAGVAVRARCASFTLIRATKTEGAGHTVFLTNAKTFGIDNRLFSSRGDAARNRGR